MRPLISGRLRQRVTLQAATETADGYNQPIQTWSDVATFWAEVSPLTGNEAVNVKQIWATATHKVRLRYQGSSISFSPTRRFVLVKDGRILNIVNANNVEERNRAYEILCQEYVTQ